MAHVHGCACPLQGAPDKLARDGCPPQAVILVNEERLLEPSGRGERPGLPLRYRDGLCIAAFYGIALGGRSSLMRGIAAGHTNVKIREGGRKCRVKGLFVQKSAS